MQKDRVTKSALIRTGILYAIILALVNYMGFAMISAEKMPIYETPEYLYWIEFMTENKVFINVLSGSAFVIPTLGCLYYIFVCSEDKLAGRLINIPWSYSLIGSMGWFISLVLETVTLVYIHLKDGINMHSIAMTSFLNIIQCCLFITTFVFMLLTTIHRQWTLPKYFPNGNLSGYRDGKKISTGFITTIFYFSVSVFPMFYLISMFRNYSLNLNFEIDPAVYLTLVGITIFCVILLVAVSNYFSTPLRKLKAATEEIKNERFDHRIDVISNDDYGDLADNFNAMSNSLLEKNRRIASIQNSIIRGMAVMVESRDNSTGGHINRTSECVRVFVNKMIEDGNFDITESFAKAIIKAAPMHDLGKIAVDDAVLRKPGRFTDEEFEIMKKHAPEGARIVEEVLRESDDEEFKKIAINVAHYHHEKWNGSGYPTKIKGEEIPYEARIMALADVFDALVSKRCYKESMSYDQAFSIIEESLGQHFDPVLGRFFISCRKELEELYMGLPE